jgi:hypothetical protein
LTVIGDTSALTEYGKNKDVGSQIIPVVKKVQIALQRFIQYYVSQEKDILSLTSELEAR